MWAKVPRAVRDVASYSWNMPITLIMGSGLVPPMVRPRLMLMMPALLLAAVLAAVPVAASGCVTLNEELVVPWLAHAPPGAQRDLLEAAEVVAVVDGPPVNGTYVFLADIAYRDCRVGPCLEMPDLRVAWYDADDAVLAVDEGELSTVEGVIPEGAAYGLIYFQTFPYVFTFPVSFPLKVYGAVCA